MELNGQAVELMKIIDFIIFQKILNGEQLKVQPTLFQQLDQACNRHALIASNTSAIPISELAAATQRPQNVLGLHFFSPVPMMQAVEVIKGVSTAHETALRGKEFVRQIGKEPIMVNRDVAGFVINRINFPSAIEAMNLVEQGVATVEDIDKGLSGNWPTGQCPPLWDGRTAERAVESLKRRSEGG